MKFKLTITKEVIDKSLMCGVEKGMKSMNCAFAIAYSELAPCQVSTTIDFLDKKENFLNIQVKTSIEQLQFIRKFDSMSFNPQERYTLVGQTFDVEIPDVVIDYWYGDIVKAAEKIIDSEVLQLVN